MDLIDREHPTSDDKPPWAGMVFRQRVYSDDMLESLKRRYPQGANFRERKHMAAIEFLQQELREMQESEAALQPQVHSVASTPDADIYDRKDQRSSSPPCSPTGPYPTSAIMNECYRGSNVPSTTLVKQHPSMSNTMPGKEIVFSVVDGPIVQRRRRKKMTPTEKIAYKQMRRVGACESCKRQKAKVDSPRLLEKNIPVCKANTMQCTHFSGTTDKSRNSQTSTSIPRSESRFVSDVEIPHSNDIDERKTPIAASESSQELSRERGASLQTLSITTPVTVSESQPYDQDMQMDAQSDSFGYVPDPADMASYSVSTNAVSGPQRNTIDPQILMMNYPPDCDFIEANEASPLFLTSGILRSGNLHAGHFSVDIWSQVQRHFADGTHPE